MKLTTKFLLVFLLISILPIVIITTYTYGRYVDLINEQINQVATNIVDSAVKDANRRVLEIDKMTEVFQLYTENTYSIVEDIKKYKSKDKHYTIYDLYTSRSNMKFICQNLIYSNTYVNGIFIFTPSGENIGYGYGNGIDIKVDYTPFDDAWYKDTLDKKGEMYVSNVSKKDFILGSRASISFSRAIYDVTTKDFLGVLFIDCSPSVLDLSSTNSFSESTLLSVVKDDGTILYSNASTNNAPYQSPKTKESENSTVVKKSLDKFDLSIVSSVNPQPLYKKFQYTRLMMIAIACACAAVFIIISIISSHSLTKPIVTLSKIMSNQKRHDLNTTDKYLNRHDEIGVLYNEYNSLIEEISQHIKEQYQNKLITLDSQMKSLEAQINSHFLYNTLESINSIAEIEEVESISTMSLALGDMFRYSIKTKSELVTIEDELKHVNDYMSIQKIRFDDRFHIVYHIAENICGLKVLKLILQPIVENCLYHGLSGCASEGTITVDCFTDGSIICFTVTDDGIGMGADTLNAVRETLAEPAKFTELGRRGKQSIGIKNIHSRIQLYYGTGYVKENVGYGLTVDSKENHGTKITIQIPIVEERD